MSIISSRVTSSVLAVLALSFTLPLTASAGGVRGETPTEAAIRKVTQQVVANDLQFESVQTNHVCGTESRGHEVTVKVKVTDAETKAVVGEVLKTYGVTEANIFGLGQRIIECAR